MAITKERKNVLLGWANDVIKNSSLIRGNGTINKSYNGQIAAFSVSVAMSGLKPALALYMNDSSSEVDKTKIVGLIAEMYNKDYNLTAPNAKDKKSLFKLVVEETDKKKIESYRKKIVEYAIALKLAVRTYKLD